MHNLVRGLVALVLSVVFGGVMSLAVVGVLMLTRPPGTPTEKKLKVTDVREYPDFEVITDETFMVVCYKHPDGAMSCLQPDVSHLMREAPEGDL